MKSIISWDDAEEVTFECEPGTLTEKLESIKNFGVTRLSLGVENFSDHIWKLTAELIVQVRYLKLTNMRES